MPIFCTAILTISTLACRSSAHPHVAIDAFKVPKRMKVSSRAFANGGRIPKANSMYGANVSPDLAWSGVPRETKSIIVLVQDPDTAQGLFTHWILYNVLPSTRSIPSGVPSKRGTLSIGLQGANDAGDLGYFGPQPPDAPVHHYHFQVFALNARLRPRPGYDTSLIYAAIHDHAICGGDLVGLYQKH